MTRGWTGAAHVHLTGVDGAVHLVALGLFEAALSSGHGRYAAACGRTVLAASLAAEPGRACALCRAAVPVARP